MSDEKTDQQKYLEAVHAKAKRQNEILAGDSVFVFAARMAAVGIRKLTLDELTIELDDSAFRKP